MMKKKKTHSSRKRRRTHQQREKQGIALGLLLLIVCLVFLYFPTHSEDQSPVTDPKQAFIDKIGAYALANYSQSHVLPSVVVAQAAVESDFGRSELAANYYNLFGYKASTTDRQVSLQTKEYVNGTWQVVQAPFKVYVNWQQAVQDHGELMQKGTDWEPQLYQGVVDATNYHAACIALAQAGYATDPNYAQKLIAIIEQYHLDELDKIAQQQG